MYLGFRNSHRLNKIFALALAFLLAVNVFSYTAMSAEDVYVYFRENLESDELNSDYFDDGSELTLPFDMGSDDTVRVVVCSDNYGSDESSWDITNINNGQIEYSGEAVSNVCDVFENSLSSGSYRFTVYDDFGDGMGCPSDGCPTNSDNETYNALVAQGDTILFNYYDLSDSDSDLSPDTIEFIYEVDADCEGCSSTAILNIDVYTYAHGEYSLVDTISEDIEVESAVDDGSSIFWDVSNAGADWDGPEFDLTFEIYLSNCNDNDDNCGEGSTVQAFLTALGEGAINEVNVVPFAIDAFEQEDYNDLVAEVYLDGQPLSGVNIRFSLSDGSDSETVETDAEGRAFFPNMQDGTWGFTATYGQNNIDHESGNVILDQTWHNSGYDRTVLVMNEANEDDIYDMIFVYAAYISGNTEETEGIDDIFVEIYTDDAKTVSLGSGYTEDGDFHISDVERGNYYYDIYIDDSEDGESDLIQQGSVFVTGNTADGSIDDGYEAPDGIYEASSATLDLHDDGAIDDTIFSVCGIGEDYICVPVADAKITLTDSNGDEISRRTDGAGEATFIDTDMGTYEYQVSHDGTVFDLGVLKVGITTPRLGVITSYDHDESSESHPNFVFYVCDNCYPEAMTTIDNAFVQILDEYDNLVDEGYTDQNVDGFNIFYWWPMGAAQADDYFTFEVYNPSGTLIGSGNLNNPTAPYYVPPEGILDSFSIILDIDDTGENNDFAARACGMFTEQAYEDGCYPVDGASITMENGGGFTVVDDYTDEEGFFFASNLSHDIYDYEFAYDGVVFDSGSFLIQSLGAGHLNSEVFNETIAGDYGFYVCYSCGFPDFEDSTTTTSDTAYVEIYHPDGSVIDEGYTDEQLDSGMTIFSWSLPEDSVASYYDYTIYSDSDYTDALMSGRINTGSEGDDGRDYNEYFESTDFYVQGMSAVVEFNPDTTGEVNVDILVTLTAYDQEDNYIDSAYLSKTIYAQDYDSFSVSIEFDDSGTYDFELSLYDTAHDSQLEDTRSSYNIKVPDNEAPVIDNFQALASLNEGEDITFSAAFTDEDGDDLDLKFRVYKGASLVVWDDSFSEGDGNYQYTWTASDNGDYTAVFTIEDQYQETEVSHYFSVINVAPTIDEIIHTENPNENQTVIFQVSASDVSPVDTLSYNWAFEVEPGTAEFEQRAGQSTEYTYADDGVYDVSITVCDDDEGCTSNIFTVTIANVPPTISNANFSVSGDDTFTFTFYVTASDPADNLTYYWNFGDGEVGNSNLYGIITHTYSGFGTYNVTAEVSDGDGGSDNATFTITIEDPEEEVRDILGCTDFTMDNYNPDATVDDGSCVPWVPPDDGDSEGSGGILESIPGLGSLFIISILGLIAILGGRRQV